MTAKKEEVVLSFALVACVLFFYSASCKQFLVFAFVNQDADDYRTSNQYKYMAIRDSNFLSRNVI